MASPKKAQGRFAEFQETLKKLDTIEARKAETAKLYAELNAAKPHEVLAFGRELHDAMMEHDENDTLAKAHQDGRTIFRSWNPSGAYDRASDTNLDGDAAKKRFASEPGAPRIGFDALNVSLNPQAFRDHKEEYRAGKSRFGPMIELPSTLIEPGNKEPVVYSAENATVTALLPEEHYAAFFAFNEVAKNMARSGKDGVDKLTDHAKWMRASVTRPVLFEADDIGSWGEAFPDKNPDNPPHVRKHSDGYTLGLNASFEDKIKSRQRSNAIFYQTFYKTAAPEKKEHDWSEMVVKFRATGHTAPLGADRKHMVETVPALKGREPLNISPNDTNPPDRIEAPTFKPIPPRKK